jgi:ribosomal-protein-alanine N-acetyltransferase
METPRLTLLPSQPEHLRAILEGPAAFESAIGIRLAEGISDFFRMASPEWLAKVQAGLMDDPWWLGYWMLHKADHAVIGTCGYKGPPDPDGMVEIAYGVAPGYQGQGYATEAAAALVAFALSHLEIRTVRAHTLAESNASTKVLTRCGFSKVGEVIDPEDGLVWRWEQPRPPG